MIYDPIFNKMLNTVRSIDDGDYKLQPLEKYYSLIETQIHGKTNMDKIKYIAGLMQQIDFLKSQQEK
jgi:hypothetical protein|tara:strand:+ start:412 stop:612 length:201 start_codon:yes stop_codon:yes gene_type:complete